MLPIRLSNLALEAFGKYLSGVLGKLASLSHDVSIENLNKIFLDPICGELGMIIQKSVPRSLADEVTGNLMTDLLKTYNNLEKQLKNRKLSSEVYKKQSLCYKQVTTAVCSAVLHCSVKEFKFSRFQFPEVNFSEARIFINSFLSVILKKLTNIRCLNLEIYEYDENIILENIKAMTNLEELTFFGCTDTIVQIVSDACEKLRILDLRNSEKVTELSVESILKLKCLEHLNIRWTAILPHGIEELIEGLKVRRTNNSLKSFQSMILPYQLKLLPVYFSNLTSVELYVHQQFSLLPLKEMTNLSHFGMFFGIVHTYSSIDLEEFLQSIGCQLTSVKLVNLRENKFVDIFRIVAQNCSKVQELVLSAIPMHFNEESVRMQFTELPVLETLKYCEIRVFHVVLLEAVLPKCVNVKVLKCWCNERRFASFVMEQLFKMRAGNMEELCANDCTLQVSGENVIVSKTNGSYMFVHRSQIEFFINEILCKRNVDIKVLCFNDVVKCSYTSLFL